MIARDHIGQHFLVSVSDVRWRIGVIDRRGDEKCLCHLYDQPLLKLSAWQANCRTNRCRASASLAVRDQQAECPTSVAYHQPGLLAAADRATRSPRKIGISATL